jgi:hypothetical protein
LNNKVENGQIAQAGGFGATRRLPSPRWTGKIAALGLSGQQVLRPNTSQYSTVVDRPIAYKTTFHLMLLIVGFIAGL